MNRATIMLKSRATTWINNLSLLNLKLALGEVLKLFQISLVCQFYIRCIVNATRHTVTETSCSIVTYWYILSQEMES